MPLQFRRGTEAERDLMSQPLAVGEPLYTTDNGKLYVGDGSTPGGELDAITGYSDEEAQSVAGQLLNSVQSDTLQLVYDDQAKTLSATIDLQNYNGIVSASKLQGSLLSSDGSTLIYDSDSDGINLEERVSSVISPNVDATHDIGTSESRFRSLYLSGTARADDFEGDLQGSVFGDDSSVIVDSVNNSIFANKITSDQFEGDLQGSVFGDDSSVIVDSVNNLVNVEEIVTNTITSLSDLDFNLADLISVNYLDPIPGPGIRLNIPVSNSNNSIIENFLDLKSYQMQTVGQSNNPAAKFGYLENDVVGGISAKLNADDINVNPSFGFAGWVVDPLTVDPAAENIATKFYLINTPNDLTTKPIQILTFDSNGRLGVNTETATDTLTVNGSVSLGSENRFKLTETGIVDSISFQAAGDSPTNAETPSAYIKVSIGTQDFWVPAFQ